MFQHSHSHLQATNPNLISPPCCTVVLLLLFFFFFYECYFSCNSLALFFQKKYTETQGTDSENAEPFTSRWKHWYLWWTYQKENTPKQNNVLTVVTSSPSVPTSCYLQIVVTRDVLTWGRGDFVVKALNSESDSCDLFLALPWSSCMTSGKSLNPSVPQFPIYKLFFVFFLFFHPLPFLSPG